MPRGTARRWVSIAGASALAHIAVLAVLALQHPHPLPSPHEPPIFEVTVAPVYLVSPQHHDRDRRAVSPIKPRPPRLSPEPLPVAPLIAAPAPGRPAAAPFGSVVGADAHPGPNPPGTQAEFGRALRFGGMGCDSPDAVRMTRQERDRCAERLGAGAKTATYLGQGLSRAKQAEFDAIAAHKAAVRKYKEAPIPPGLATSGAAGGLTGLGDTAHGDDPTHKF